MGLIVNSVGDAACISLLPFDFTRYDYWDYRGRLRRQRKNEFLSLSDFSIDLVIDYGKYNQNTHTQVSRTSNFLLTHFHRDHYYGFEQGYEINGCKYENIKNFYYQKLPRINNNESNNQPSEREQQLAFLICFVNVLESFRYLRDNSQCSLFNLLDVIDDTSINIIAVGAGDRIKTDRNSYTVIWPPESIEQDDNVTKKIKEVFSKLEKYDKELIQSEYNLFKKDCIKKLQDKTDAQEVNKHSVIDIAGITSSYFKSLNNKLILNNNDYKDKFIAFCCLKRKTFYEFRREMMDVIDNITNITNDLSVCTYNSELLQLGDLGKNINKCINSCLSRINSPILPVKHFITAHHGTHWDSECNNIKADYVISSNGIGRFRDLKCKYIDSLKDDYKNPNEIKKRFYSTYTDGDFLE